MAKTFEDRGGLEPFAKREFRIALRINEACSALGIGRSSLYELIAAGEIKTSMVAGRRLIPVKELERLLENGMRTAN